MALPPTQSLHLPPEARSASAGRHFVQAVLLDWDAADLVDAAALLTSELITNAVLHARTPLTVTVRMLQQDCVQIAVTDGSTYAPQRRQPLEDSTSGRGVGLMDVLANSWNVTTSAAGKTVSFTLDANADPLAEAAPSEWLAEER